MKILKTPLARHFGLFFLTLFFSKTAFSQTADNRELFRYRAVKTTENIQIDGLLDENCWQNAAVATGFAMKWPNDVGNPQNGTVVKVAFDGEQLYVAATLDDPDGYVINTLKRDMNFFDSDCFLVAIDPVGKKSNGYLFGLSAAGVQGEGLISADEDDPDGNWDQKWRSEVVKTATGWQLEMAIPFQILKYPAGQNQWGIQFIRGDQTLNEWSTWAKMPLNFNGFDLGWLGTLEFAEPPARQGGNATLIPYASGSLSNDYVEKTGWEAKPNLGLDAKIAVGSSMNLDLTLNPDFSQIEVDEQQTNLTRFDIFLPEKRTFFLENADLFGSFGIPPLRPFFTRTIGLDANGRAVPILGGARLSGNLNDRTRIGLMNMQTGKKGDEPATNFTAAALHRQVLSRSNLKFLFTNKQSFADKKPDKTDYGRNAGIEFTYRNKPGSFTAWATGHGSWHPLIEKNKPINSRLYNNTGIFIATKKVEALFDVLFCGEDYYNETGYNLRIDNYNPVLDESKRLGYIQYFNEINYYVYPKDNNSRITRHWFGIENLLFANGSDLKVNERFMRLRYFLMRRNTTSWQFRMDNTITNALYPFSFFDAEEGCENELPARRYDNTAFNVEYESDNRKNWFFNTSVWYGQFYNGHKLTVELDANFRISTIGRIALRFQENRLTFPDPFCDADLWSVAPRVEVFFNRNLFWTTFLQYNFQADNFNVNSRLQWRFKPMSDLFLVYTDNYRGTDLLKQNRGLVLKLNYWLNL